MKYAKLTDQGIEYAPLNNLKDNVLNFGTKANEAQLLALGYLPVVDGEIPEVGENQTLKPIFTQGEGVIIRSYEVVDLPPDRMAQLERLLNIILGGESDG